MGIKFLCPGGHKLHVKAYLAGHRGVCPQCGQRFLVPNESLPNIRVEPLVLTPEELAATPRGEALDLETSAGATVGAAPANPSTAGTAPAARASESRSTGTAPTSNSELRWSGDPLSEAPQAMWYLRLASGDQYGPAKADLMRRWLDEGRVPAEGYVWREGWTDWRRAGVTFPQLLNKEATTTAPTTVAVSNVAATPGVRVSSAAPGKTSAETAEPSSFEEIDELLSPAGSLGLPIGVTRSTARSSARPQSRQNQALIVVALVLGVLILLPILYVVLVQQ